MIYPLDTIDNLTWCDYYGEIVHQADKSGWRVKDKNWKAQRQALWDSINSGAYISFKEQYGRLEKTKALKMIEEFFLTGKSKHRVGKGTNPVNLTLYFLFYPELTVDILDGIIGSLPAAQMAEHKADWLFPVWYVQYLNYPGYFSERLKLLQDYFWPEVQQITDIKIDVPENIIHQYLMGFRLYVTCYLIDNGGLNDSHITAPYYPCYTSRLNYLFYLFNQYSHVMTSVISDASHRDWLRLFLHIRHYAPWNALPNAGLEGQQNFVNAFKALVQQRGLPEPLWQIWHNAEKAEEAGRLSLEESLSQANKRALLCHVEADMQQLAKVVNCYHGAGFSSAGFDSQALKAVNLAALLHDKVKAEWGYDADKPVAAYCYDIELTGNYYYFDSNRRILSVLLILPGNNNPQSPVMLVVERPFPAAELEVSRRTRSNGNYMSKLLAKALEKKLFIYKDFSYLYLLQELGRNPKVSSLTDEEQVQMQQSVWYRRDQQFEPFIDKPFYLFKRIPTADEVLPIYDGELPALDGK